MTSERKTVSVLYFTKKVNFFGSINAKRQLLYLDAF